jgi:hypothetical protein
MDAFYDKAAELLAIMTEYNEASDRFGEVDLYEEDMMFAVDDLQTIVDERENLRCCMESASAGMAQAFSELCDTDKASAKNSEAMTKLLDLQSEIAGKDTEILRRYSVRLAEVKRELKNLQSEKKKLDFLHLSAVGEQDSGFNV